MDGRRRRVERVNGDFLGCVIEQGQHEIHFVFRPASIYYGQRLSIVGFVILSMMAAASLMAERLQRRALR